MKMVMVLLKNHFAVAKVFTNNTGSKIPKREIMKKAKINRFDLKDMVDLVQGFNATVMRITCNQSQEERAKLINSLGQRMIDLGTQMTEVTVESIKN